MPNRYTVLIVALVGFGIVGCSSSEEVSKPVQPKASALKAAPKTKTNHDGLVYLAQEEKVAHDVYVTLGKKWPHYTFTNIQRSEARHMQAVGRLLAKRGLKDPNADLAPGKFHDAKLQAMHDKLIKQGSVSLKAALKVGALIEEQDISDLNDVLAKKDNDQDVIRVLTNLRRASYNHLDGFASALEKEASLVYKPQLLAPNVYQEARNQGAAHHKMHRGKGHGKGHGQGKESCDGGCEGCAGEH